VAHGAAGSKADDGADTGAAATATAGAGADSNAAAGQCKVSKEQLCKVFEGIIRKMQQVMVHLAGTERKLQMDARAKGIQIPPQQMHTILMKQFEEYMSHVEEQVYKTNGCTEEEVQEASQVHADDPDFQKLVKTLKNLYKMVSGQTPDPAECPAHITLELVCTVMAETFEAITKCMEEVMSEVRADEDLKAQGPQALNQAVSSRYMERANKLRAEILKKHDMSQDDLQASVVKYQTEPKLQQLISRLTFDQQQRFKKLGIESPAM